MEATSKPLAARETFPDRFYPLKYTFFGTDAQLQAKS